MVIITNQAQGTIAIVLLMFCSGSTALSVVANTLPAYRAIASYRVIGGTTDGGGDGGEEGEGVREEVMGRGRNQWWVWLQGQRSVVTTTRLGLDSVCYLIIIARAPGIYIHPGTHM